MNSTVLSQSLEIIEKNEDILAAIVENLQIGRIDDCMKHYSILQANLISLATELDNFPAGSSDPYKKVTEFPDLIMRKDISDDLQPIGFKSLLEPPLVPACSNCAKQQISSDFCRENLGHVDVHHKFTQIEREEFYCATQVLSTKHSKFSEDIGNRKKPRSYKRWAPHEKFSLMAAISIFGLNLPLLTSMFENTRTESQIRCYVLKQLKVNDKGRLDISFQDLLAQKPLGYQPPAVLAMHFATQTTAEDGLPCINIDESLARSINLTNPTNPTTTINTTNTSSTSNINTSTTTTAATSQLTTHPILYPNKISHIHETAQFESNVTNSLIAPKPGSCEWDILVAIAADLQIRIPLDASIEIANNSTLATPNVSTTNIPQELHAVVSNKNIPAPPIPQQIASSSLHPPNHTNNPLSIHHPAYHNPTTSTAATATTTGVYASPMTTHTFPSIHYNNSNAHHLMQYPPITMSSISQQMAANSMAFMQHHPPPSASFPHHPTFQKESIAHTMLNKSSTNTIAHTTMNPQMLPIGINASAFLEPPLRPHQPPYLSAVAQSNLIQQQQQQAKQQQSQVNQPISSQSFSKIETNSASINSSSEVVFDVEKKRLSSKITLPSIAATSALLPPPPIEAPYNLRDPLKERITLENYLHEQYQYNASYYARHIYPTLLKQQQQALQEQQALLVNKSQKNRKAPSISKPGINKLKQHKNESLTKYNTADNSTNQYNQITYCNNNNDNNNSSNSNNNSAHQLETITKETMNISNTISDNLVNNYNSNTNNNNNNNNNNTNTNNNNNNNNNQSLFNSVLIGDQKKKNKRQLTDNIPDNNQQNITNTNTIIINPETIKTQIESGLNNNQDTTSMGFNNNPENVYHISGLNTSAALEVSSSELLDEYSNSLSYGASVMSDFGCEFSFL